MTDVNEDRGEVPILLDGKLYPMRPSYAAVKAIESSLGPVMAIAPKLAHPMHRLTVNELAVIVTEAVRAAGKERDDKILQSFSTERVAELIYDGGVMNVIDQIELLVINMITGGTKSEKKTGDRSESPKESTTAT